MARNIHRLTDRQVKNATQPIGDGGNLWLYPEGHARLWVFRYSNAGKQREMGLGGYPAVTLAEARQRAAEARELRRQGIDPIEHRAQALAHENAPEVVPTFTQAAAAFIRLNRHGWNNRKHARQWTATLKTYARPILGNRPVDKVTTEHILTVLKPIWTTKTETAKRVQGRIENILDFAAARQWRDPANPARWRGHLDKLLPKPTKVKTVRQQPALPYQDVGAFLVELRRLTSVSARALELLILTACRTGEVLGAQWTEIDLPARVWTIPAARMKGNREHRVPLSDAAMAVIETLPRIVNHPYVFPGAKHGRPLSNMALLQVMRGLGYGVGGTRGDAVPHGFRSSFRDWAGEVSSFPNHVCEMALAHVIGNKAEKAYRRGDLFDKRRAMMQQWADWCAASGGTDAEPETCAVGAPERSRSAVSTASSLRCIGTVSANDRMDP
ncbi:tyrosine-type recombinase/integrase [Thiocapsa roseopersicina]|uniref:Integrase n=1 Tax=Thiocapsa roseopersicina TaxID=1058 RepID=A0A1H3DC34_THIRO|nr:site-specific integrase [Thiocapsa roseopersicina]CRI66642.1 Integrase family protein [Thiocapsa sp. KS1]SDX63229.1 Integrase [Thiocapsa roseopersicina]